MESWLQMASMAMIANDNSLYLLSRNETSKKTIHQKITPTNASNIKIPLKSNSTTPMKNTIITLTLTLITMDENDGQMMIMRQSDQSVYGDMMMIYSTLISTTQKQKNQNVTELMISNNDQNFKAHYDPVLIYSRSQPGLIQFRQIAYARKSNEQGNNDNTTINASPITFSRSPTTFDIDPFDNNIYYLDDFKTNLLYEDLSQRITQSLSSIEEISHMNRTKRIDLKFFTPTTTNHPIQIETISFDWCNYNVYLLESSAISVINFVAESERQVWRKILINNLIEPRALVLDSKRGLMFFTATIMTDNKERDDDTMITTLYPYAIRKANMDGTQVTIFGEHLDRSTSYVSSLAIDIDQALLYWTDTGEKTINRMNYLTENMPRRERIWQSSRINIANSLVYFNNTLFWIEIQHGSIQQFDLKTNLSHFIHEERGPLFQLKVWLPKHNDTRSEVCLGGRIGKRKHSCQQLTLRTSGNRHSICACDDHYESVDNGNCRQLSVEQLSKKFCTASQVYLSRGRRCVQEKQENSIRKPKSHRSRPVGPVEG